MRTNHDAETMEGVTDAAAFEAELTELIRTAETNGVAVDGGWVSAADNGEREWGIEIYEVDRYGGEE